MRKLLQLTLSSLLIIFLFSHQASATHVMGSDISYKCVGNSKFEVTVKMYRDCRGVPMSTIDITVSRTGASTTITTTRTSIKDISNVCSSGTKPCTPVNTANVGKGVEEHTFACIVDFTKAPFNTTAWQNACEITFGFGQCCRNGAISTGQSNANFYSEATMNKCEAICNNSPQFSNVPYSFLCASQPVYQNTGAIDTIDYDSLSYKLVAPLSSASTSPSYATSNLCGKPFSATMPLTPFLLNPCGPHVPKPNLYPPQGFYLNPTSGDIVFTPNQSGEVGIVVLEVTEWRKNYLGVYKKIGTIRRDIQFWIENCSGNSGPIFTSNLNSYDICANQPVNIIIEAKDLPFNPPPPLPPPPLDNVYINWNKSIPGATLTPISLGSTSKYLFSWTPTNLDIKPGAHTAVFTVTDDHCPIPSIAQKSISFFVRPSALADVKATQLSCNRLRLETSPWLNQSPSSFVWNIFELKGNEKIFIDSVKNTNLTTIDLGNGGTYVAEMFTSNAYGCGTEYSDTFVYDYKVDIGKDTFFCDTQQYTIHANVTGGVLPYQYQWSILNAGNVNSITINVTKDTTIYVDVADSTGCIVRDEIFIDYNPTISLNLGADISYCGKATTVLDAKNPFAKFTWNTNDTTQRITTDSTGGTYWVEARICSDTARDTVKQIHYYSPVVDLGVDKNFCSTFSTTLGAGSIGTSYLWQPGNNITSTKVVTQPNTYILKVTNGVCPEVSDTIVITRNPNPQVNLGADKRYCSIIKDTLNAYDPFSSYLWSDNTTTPKLAIDTPGTYWVKVSKCNNDVTDTIVIGLDTMPILELGPSINYCDSIDVILDTKNAGMQHSWSTGDTTQTLHITTPGTYVHQIINGACKARDTISLHLDSIPDKNLPALTRHCGAFIQVLDAKNPFALNVWSTGDTADKIAVTQPGTYWVKSTMCDSTVYDTAVIIRDTMPIVNLGLDSNYCDTFSRTLVATNTNATYIWNTNATTDTLVATAPGNYIVAVLIGACVVRDTVQLTMDTTISVNLGPDISYCDSINITLVAGNPTASYLWSTSSTEQVINIDTAGIYTVDVHLCGDTISDTIAIIRDIVQYAQLKDTFICDSDSITISAGITASGYLWSNNDTTITTHVNDSGIYWVQVNNGICRNTKSYFEVFNDSSLNVDLGPDKHYCGTFTPFRLDVTNVNATYLWSNGKKTASIDIDTAGTYWVAITNNCGTIRDTINVYSHSNVSINLGNDTNVCSNSLPFTLDAGNYGSTFSWSNSATTQKINITQTGTYTVSVTNTCNSDFAQIYVRIDDPFLNLPDDSIFCDNINLPVILPLANNYLWNTTDTVKQLTLATPGTYWAQIENSCGVYNDTILIDVDSALSLNLGVDTTYCDTFSRILDVTNHHAEYTWSNNYTGSSITIDSAGTYWVSVSNKCGILKDTIVIDTLRLDVNLGHDTSFCGSFSYSLDAGNSGATYSWSPFFWTKQNFTANSAGSYSVSVTNFCGTKSDTILIAQENPLTINLGADTSICYNSQINLSTTYNQNYSYQWSTGETSSSIHADSASAYWVKVTNICGSYYDTINVSTDSSLFINLGNDTGFCGVVNINLKAGVTASEYLWSNSSTADNITVSSLGNYWVNVTNSCGTYSDTIQLIKHNKPSVNIGNDTIICNTFNKTLNANTGGILTESYLWFNTDTSQSITIDTLGIYWVEVTNICGTTRDSITILDSTLLMFDLGPDTLICDRPDLQLGLNIPNATYHWSTNPNDTNATVVIDSSGLYWVEVKLCTQTAVDSINIRFNNTPTGVYLGMDTTYSTSSTNDSLDAGFYEGASYLWSNSDTNQKIPITTAGGYWVKVTNECGSMSDSINILFTGISQHPDIAEHINIYPNPSSGAFSINFENIRVSNLTINITSADGKSVYSNTISTGLNTNHSEPINLTNYPSGIYYITLQSENKTYTFKVIVSR